MKNILAIVALVIFTVPAFAGMKVEPWSATRDYLESLPPLSESERTNFNQAAFQTMYEQDCNCYVFLFHGEKRKAPYPLSDYDRYLISAGVQNGSITLVPRPN